MSIAFDVDAVTPALEPLPATSWLVVLSRTLKSDCYGLDGGQPTTLTYAGPETVVDRPTANPLASAVHYAFANHYPLTLTPDAIWTTIAQGFALHIRLHAEALRHQFVDHQGKKVLGVTLFEVPTTPDAWARVVHDWCTQIRANVGPGAADFFANTFTTSGSVERTVGDIVMMDAFERYFDYFMRCICGIPCIELTGTSEDWREIRRRVDLMMGTGVDDWVARLREICDQFIETANGRPDRDFWQCLYKPREVYGGYVSNGWLNRLFPYLETAQGFHRNDAVTNGPSEHTFSSEPSPGASGRFPPTVTNADRTPSRCRWLSAGASPSSFPHGLCRVPVAVSMPDGSVTPLELIGGLTGMVQDATTRAIRPALGWAVCTRPAETRPTLSAEECYRETVARMARLERKVAPSSSAADIVRRARERLFGRDS